MNRRQFHTSSWLSVITLAAWARNAQALNLADLSSADASSGLKAALEKGAIAAVGLLGVTDGFMGNDKVRIALPGYLNDAASWMKKLGQGKKVDELVLAMNRAAESAVPMAKDLLVDAVKAMSVADAKSILQGGNTAATQYFSSKTREPLGAQFLPIITQATAKVGLVKPQDASLEHYVTGKSLDGLYWMIGEEEKNLRQDPLSAGSDLLRKVFGALK